MIGRIDRSVHRLLCILKLSIGNDALSQSKQNKVKEATVVDFREKRMNLWYESRTYECFEVRRLPETLSMALAHKSDTPIFPP